MDRFDRIFQLSKILQHSRYPVSRHRLELELECSTATVNASCGRDGTVIAVLVSFISSLSFVIVAVLVYEFGFKRSHTNQVSASGREAAKFAGLADHFRSVEKRLRVKK